MSNLVIAQIQAIANNINRLLGKVKITDGTNDVIVRDVTGAKALDVSIVNAAGAQITTFGTGATGRPCAFEDTSFVTGDSPVTLDVNTALSRNAIHGYVANDGAGNFTVQISDDNGSTFSDAITMKSGDVLSLEMMDVDQIKITWVANSAYRVCAW